MTSAEQQLIEDEQEISINDIISFFLTHWKLLLIGATSGLVIAFGAAAMSGQYEAEATLINRSSANSSSANSSSANSSSANSSSIDYFMWKSLKRNLPILAAKVAEQDGNSESFLKVLSSEKWWDKNVVPTFAFTKDDAKDVMGMSKEMQDAEATKIKNFVVKATGSSKEDALKNLSVATSFLRGGSAYLALKDVIANYQLELVISGPEIENKLSSLKIELIYLANQMADLELLRKKFPGNTTSIITQTTGTGETEAKYLPITMQLIAINKDISSRKEDLSRLMSKKSQFSVMNDFLSQANPVLNKNFDGLTVAAELMQIESGMRKNLQPTDWNEVSMLNNIKRDLSIINTRFTLGLEQPTFFSTHKPSYRKPAAIGLFSGFFLALLGSFCSAIWVRYRREVA